MYVRNGYKTKITHRCTTDVRTDRAHRDEKDEVTITICILAIIASRGEIYGRFITGVGRKTWSWKKKQSCTTDIKDNADRRQCGPKINTNRTMFNNYRREVAQALREQVQTQAVIHSDFRWPQQLQRQQQLLLLNEYCYATERAQRLRTRVVCRLYSEIREVQPRRRPSEFGDKITGESPTVTKPQTRLTVLNIYNIFLTWRFNNSIARRVRLRSE